MSDKKNLLLVTRDQFGYHVDPYAYAIELTRHFDVTYFCWDYDRPRIQAAGVRVIYSSRSGSLLRRNLRFMRELRTIVPDFAVTLLFYFAGAALVLPGMGSRLRDRIICDVRTGSVTDKALTRNAFNAFLKMEMRAFRHRSFISESLGKAFGFKQFNVLPLGACVTPGAARSYEALHLLYVGTFATRDIHESVAGLGIFLRAHGSGISCRYTIIGSGSVAEEEMIRTEIRHYGLEDVVELTGFIQRDSVAPYLQRANVGVSYVPITDYYNFQPVTKTYEYFLAGLPVLATATHENTLVIEPHNGVLIDSTPEAFAAGLETLYRRRSAYSAGEIRARAAQYSYAHIVDTQLAGYLRTVLQPELPVATAELVVQDNTPSGS
ncbi:hypothetical protein LEM8419_00823 [Neolewinella maritima]|uniref:Glycosyltransferase n=1 Tax=Neolewinella maritima TaxID=1383882 RepID=A0ABN8F341_9BACT|nr:glycosyltransferase family 4 protein [Neolewinella maritima]CAH0999523.1 hypothetical protein LEM8419_00823 [Neolewinella maritima]